MELHTEQPSLRLLGMEDAEAMHALRYRNRRFLEPFEPVQSDESFTLEAVQRTIRQYLDEQRQDISYSFGIFLRHDGELVGRLRLSSHHGRGVTGTGARLKPPSSVTAGGVKEILRKRSRMAVIKKNP